MLEVKYVFKHKKSNICNELAAKFIKSSNLESVKICKKYIKNATPLL